MDIRHSDWLVIYCGIYRTSIVSRLHRLRCCWLVYGATTSLHSSILQEILHLKLDNDKVLVLTSYFITGEK